MLVNLSIENFAIIESASIDFATGMTVLSGETGAGKSIIIDALSLLCGGRGSTSYIRESCDKFVIQGLFILKEPSNDLLADLDQLGISLEDQQLVLSREINQAGANLVRVNDRLMTVSALKKIGRHLVDIHGQNEHQALLDKESHLGLLDRMAGPDFQALLTDYQATYQEYRRLRSNYLASLNEDRDQRQRIDFLQFQIQELEAANLSAEEDQELEALSRRLQNQEQIQARYQAVSQALSEGPNNVLTQLSDIETLLDELNRIQADYGPLVDQVKAVRLELEDLSFELARLDQGDLEGVYDLDEVESRLAELGALKSKYGLSIPDLIDYYQEISDQVYQLLNRDKYLDQLQAQLQQAYDQVLEQADQLHSQRLELAQVISQQVEGQLADLYMENSRFEVVFKTTPADQALNQALERSDIIQVTGQGYDQVEFYVATNLGELAKPLIQVASGGELSRLMLALKTVFSQGQASRVMVFDEIDTGVSGRVASAIAAKIKQVSQAHQVLCITHLAQVAAIADQQLLIEKGVADGRTYTQVSQLTRDQRVEVLAQMISGQEENASSRQLASDLLASYHEEAANG